MYWIRHTGVIAGLSLALALSWASGCGGDALPDVDCVDVPAFDDVVLLQTSCANCHSSQRTGPLRNGAPAGVNFDTQAGAAARAERGVIRVFAGTMPPGGGGALAEADKRVFYTWGLCGTPP